MSEYDILRDRFYDTAVRWIANNDNPDDAEDALALEGYLTVALVADVFNTTASAIAHEVLAYRDDDMSPATREFLVNRPPIDISKSGK